MATPYTDMQDAVWTYLGLQASYTALSLNEHKGHDGDLLPFDEDRGMFPDGSLPALTCNPNAAVERRGFLENGYEDVVRAEFSLIYAASGGLESRATIEAAADTILGILDSRDAHRTRLGDATAVAQYTVTQDEVRALRDEKGGEPRFWVWNFDVELVGNRGFKS